MYFVEICICWYSLIEHMNDIWYGWIWWAFHVYVNSLSWWSTHQILLVFAFFLLLQACSAVNALSVFADMVDWHRKCKFPFFLAVRLLFFVAWTNGWFLLEERLSPFAMLYIFIQLYWFSFHKTSAFHLAVRYIQIHRWHRQFKKARIYSFIHKKSSKFNAIPICCFVLVALPNNPLPSALFCWPSQYTAIHLLYLQLQVMITIDFIQDCLSVSVGKCGYYTGLVYLSCGLWIVVATSLPLPSLAIFRCVTNL